MCSHSGAGGSSLGDFAFRSALPHLRPDFSLHCDLQLVLRYSGLGEVFGLSRGSALGRGLSNKCTWSLHGFPCLAACRCASAMHTRKLRRAGAFQGASPKRTRTPVIEIRNDWQMNQTCTAQADYIGWGCFASYSLLIPGFLVYMIVRQRKVMTPIDHFVCFATADREKRNFHVSVRASLEEGDKTRAAMKDGVCCFSQILL